MSSGSDDTVAIAVVSDGHTNSKVALCPPSLELDEGGTHRANRTQCALFEGWVDFWKQFGKVKANTKIGVFNGDLGETGRNRRNSQVVTNNIATVTKMIHKILEPAVDKLDKMYVVRGSPFHTGQAGWLEEMIAQDYDIAVPRKWSDEVDLATGEREKAIASWYHIRKIAAGVKFDIAHHGSMGALPWTEKHAALKVVEKVLWRYMIGMRKDPPDVVIRSHRHVYSDSGSNYDTFGLFTPCWSSITEFAYRTGRENDTASIGGVWFVCRNGKYRFKHLKYEPLEVSQIWQVQAEF